jgi:hypothetical protein
MLNSSARELQYGLGSTLAPNLEPPMNSAKKQTSVRLLITVGMRPGTINKVKLRSVYRYTLKIMVLDSAGIVQTGETQVSRTSSTMGNTVNQGSHLLRTLHLLSAQQQITSNL